MTPIVSRSRLSTRRHFTRRSGAIAQLGERVVRNDEVGGSIPPGSTTLRPSGFAWRSREMPVQRSVVPGDTQRAKTGCISLRRFRHHHVRRAAQPAIEKMLQPGALGDVVAGAPGKVLIARPGPWHVETLSAARRPAAHHRVGHVGMKLKAKGISGTKGLPGKVTAFRQYLSPCG